MNVFVHTDHHTEGHMAVVDGVEAAVLGGLSRYGDRLTRVDVHLSDDQHRVSSGGTTRCLIEAQAAGMSAVTVSHHGRSAKDSVSGAVDKLDRLLTNRFGRETARSDHDLRRHES